jgi:hypothetical protein
MSNTYTTLIPISNKKCVSSGIAPSHGAISTIMVSETSTFNQMIKYKLPKASVTVPVYNIANDAFIFVNHHEVFDPQNNEESLRMIGRYATIPIMNYTQSIINNEENHILIVTNDTTKSWRDFVYDSKDITAPGETVVKLVYRRNPIILNS